MSRQVKHPVRPVRETIVCGPEWAPFVALIAPILARIDARRAKAS